MSLHHLNPWIRWNGKVPVHDSRYQQLHRPLADQALVFLQSREARAFQDLADDSYTEFLWHSNPAAIEDRRKLMKYVVMVNEHHDVGLSLREPRHQRLFLHLSQLEHR